MAYSNRRVGSFIPRKFPMKLDFGCVITLFLFFKMLFLYVLSLLGLASADLGIFVNHINLGHFTNAVHGPYEEISQQCYDYNMAEDMQAALPYAEALVRMEPGNAMHHYHLARNYLLLNELVNALFHYNWVNHYGCCFCLFLFYSLCPPRSLSSCLLLLLSFSFAIHVYLYVFFCFTVAILIRLFKSILSIRKVKSVLLMLVTSLKCTKLIW